MTPAEVALAVGRPGCDLAYVARGLEETERHAWYMRREGEHFLFRTRASVNKRFQERQTEVQPGEIRETLDAWVQEIYSGFSAFQVIPFPQDHTAIANTSERVRLVLVHYDKECGAVGGGDRLNVTKDLFTKTGVNESRGAIAIIWSFCWQRDPRRWPQGCGACAHGLGTGAR